MIDDVTKLHINKCPFCKYDGNATAVVIDHSHGKETKMVECGGCGALGPTSEAIEIYLGIDHPDEQRARKEAIDRWNSACS